MSLGHILLGLLAEPASGYDLGKEFEASLAHFWSANLSQIYPTLERLEEDGLVTSEAAAPARGPARRLYRRTDAGDRALRDWLANGPDFNPQRLSWLAQTYFLASADDMGTARDFLARMLAGLGEQQARLAAIMQGWREASDAGFPESLSDRDHFAWLTLSLGIATAEARIAWCRDALARADRRGRPAG